MTDFANELLDESAYEAPTPELYENLYPDRIFVTALKPEELAVLLPQLQQAGLTDVIIERESDLIKRSGSVELSRAYLEQMKSYLYALPQEAAAIQRLVTMLPAPEREPTSSAETYKGTKGRQIIPWLFFLLLLVLFYFVLTTPSY